MLAVIIILFLVLGVIVLVMDISEIWLSRGLTTLICGLQAS